MVDISKFILVNLFVLSSSHEINYCGSKMCGYTDTHTLCQFSSGPSSECTGYIPAPLQPGEKSRVLARLNRRRDEAASGKLRGLPSAGNMLKLRWVGELAREAQMWADQCRPPRVPEEHDVCRDLYSITVGQCVASVVGEAPGLRVESMVDIWYMQSIYYKGNVTLYEPPESRTRFYADFAQMMWARAYMVGCGRSRFMISVRGRFRTVERLVCNFAPLGPPLYRPLWMPGVPATTCPTRSRPYDALTSSLCDYLQEMNQPNYEDNSMTLEEHILLNTVLEMERNETQYRGSLDEIYLTYLAIVTMQKSDATTAHSNSIQKRDIVEKFGIGEENTNSVKLSNYGNNLNRTIELKTIKNRFKKKLKIIGRPKAYNIEELSDIGGDKTEEYHDTTESMSKHKRNFYEDYNMDSTEENMITETSEHNEIEKNVHDLTNKTIDNNDIGQQFQFVNVETKDRLENLNYAAVLTERASMISLSNQIKFDTITNEEFVDKSTEIHSTMVHTTSNDTLATTDRIMEDYLSDPETVGELEKALDRMEHESNASKSSGKTRRDLRDVPPETVEANGMNLVSNDVTIQSVSEISTLSAEEERNISLERAPMLDMVMKYMPYLKSYENEILRTQSSANYIFPSPLIISSVYLILF